MTKFAYILGISAVPSLILGFYLYFRHPGQRSIRQSLHVFFLGTFSILPVIVFHRWVLGELMAALKQDWAFLSHSFWQSVVELSLLLLFIFLFITFFALFSHFFKSKRGASTLSVFKKLYNLTPILLFFLSFLLIEGTSTWILDRSFVLSLAGGVIVFAVLEEYFKYLINPFLVHQKIHSVATAMINALYVGLAFAFVENILFFYAFYDAPDFQRIVLYRSFFTTLLHVCASGIFGYFYGLSLFANSMLTTYEIEKAKYNLPFWVRLLFRKETIFKSISVNQGFLVAAAVHSGFNLFLHFNQRFLASFTVILVALMVVYLLHSKTNRIQYGLIGTTTMPQLDFEKLRLKIAVLKAQKQIQQERYHLA